MKKLLLILMLAVVSSSAMAEWTKVVDAIATTEGSNYGTHYTVYSDVSSIRKSGNSVILWELYDYQTTQNEKNIKPYLSQEVRTEYDCPEERSRELYIAVFAKNMGEGKRLLTISNTTNWRALEPDTIGPILLQFACGK